MRKTPPIRSTASRVIGWLCCVIAGHWPAIIWCGDRHCESTCGRCGRKITGNMLGDWWVDRRPQDRKSPEEK